MILLDALHINNSGGKVLLDYLIANLHDSNMEVFYLLDERVKGSYPFLPEVKVQYLPAGLWTRYQFYRQRRHTYRVVFCFGNIPPPIRLDCKVYTYFHNVLFIDIPSNTTFNKRVNLLFKRAFLRLLLSNTDEWWVQTESVRREFCQRMGVSSDSVRLYPFFPDFPKSVSSNTREVNSFLFVSDANPHKNHMRLLDAFEIVWSQNSQDVHLYLTVSNSYPDVLNRVASLTQQGYPIFNLGLISREELSLEYQRRGFLIYPSLVESFGLGLIEAAQLGMPIVAADRPYVHTVVSPFLVFDPTNTESISHCINLALSKKPIPSPLKLGNSMPKILTNLNSTVNAI